MIAAPLPSTLTVDFTSGNLVHAGAIVREGDTVTARLEYSYIHSRIVVSEVRVVGVYEQIREMGDVVSVQDGYGFILPYRTDRQAGDRDSHGKPAHMYFHFSDLIGTPASATDDADSQLVDVYDPSAIGIVHLGDTVTFDVEFDV